MVTISVYCITCESERERERARERAMSLTTTFLLVLLSLIGGRSYWRGVHFVMVTIIICILYSKELLPRSLCTPERNTDSGHEPAQRERETTTTQRSQLSEMNKVRVSISLTRATTTFRAHAKYPDLRIKCDHACRRNGF